MGTFLDSLVGNRQSVSLIMRALEPHGLGLFNNQG
jgi:hypothetical protein